jgi:hypothetical protein
MNTSLRVAAAAAMGVGFIFAVPTVVVNAAPYHSCVGGNSVADAICAGCALGGTSPLGSCAGGGVPAAQPPAALPAPAPAGPPGPATPWLAPPGYREPPPMPVLAPPPPQPPGVPCGPTDTIAKAEGGCGR